METHTSPHMQHVIPAIHPQTTPPCLQHVGTKVMLYSGPGGSLLAVRCNPRPVEQLGGYLVVNFVVIVCSTAVQEEPCSLLGVTPDR